MPIDYSKYPGNWKEIRARILDRANNRCEFCGVDNYAVGARDRISGTWHNEDNIHCMNSSVGAYLFGDFPKLVKIVLTIAHLDHDVNNNDPDNLKALCQRCHLRHDARDNATKAAATRARKIGQMDLFGDDNAT